jgi:hypothetical protein
MTTPAKVTCGCTEFGGVCAACPENPARKARSVTKRDAASCLPPQADRAIMLVTQCRGLTTREREVLTLCCCGQKNTIIGISPSAVRRHLRNLHRKTNTADKAELILNLWHSCRNCPNDLDIHARGHAQRSTKRRRQTSPRKPIS